MEKFQVLIWLHRKFKIIKTFLKLLGHLSFIFSACLSHILHETFWNNPRKSSVTIIITYYFPPKWRHSRSTVTHTLSASKTGQLAIIQQNCRPKHPLILPAIIPHVGHNSLFIYNHKSTTSLIITIKMISAKIPINVFYVRSTLFASVFWHFWALRIAFKSWCAKLFQIKVLVATQVPFINNNTCCIQNALV